MLSVSRFYVFSVLLLSLPMTMPSQYFEGDGGDDSEIFLNLVTSPPLYPSDEDYMDDVDDNYRSFPAIHAPVLLSRSSALDAKDMTKKSSVATKKPYFVEALSSSNVTVNPGDTAVISCFVKNLGQHLVIWRRSDAIIPLTIGSERHVLDNRVAVEANLETGEWKLLIREARSSDSGGYACQVNFVQGDGSYLERSVKLRVRDIPLLVIDARAAVVSSEVVVTKLADMASMPRPILYGLLKTNGQTRKPAGGDNRPLATVDNALPLAMPTAAHQPGLMRHGQNYRKNTEEPLILGELAIGGTDFIEKGRNLELSCNATSMSEEDAAPRTLEWFKDGEKLESSRDSGFFIAKHAVGRTLYSTLIAYKANLKHAGDYVCRVPDLNAQEIFKVVVLNVQPSTVKRGTGHQLNSSTASFKYDHLVQAFTTFCFAVTVLLTQLI